MAYKLEVANPNMSDLGYVLVVANIHEKHDRSAPSDFHWKVLKCRMLIFSNSSILACPDKQDIKKVHVIFNKIGDNYDKLNSLLLKFSLSQDGVIRQTTPDIYKSCFHYTMLAKLAPNWNTLGPEYLVNCREFLTAKGPHEGVKCHITSNEIKTTLIIKPIKVNLIRSNDFCPGEYVRVLPSLNKAILEDYLQSFPTCGLFKSYKDLRRHWKNIHGYRLPEHDESTYCLVRFWRGEPFTYPKLCILRNQPIVTPMPMSEEKEVLKRFLSSVKRKMPNILGSPIAIETNFSFDLISNETLTETQAITLCTPTQV